MRLPPKDDPQGDMEGRLPLEDVLTVLRRHDVSVTTEASCLDGAVCCTLISEDVSEVQFLSDPVGGVMVKYLARKFEIETVEFYYFRQLDAQRERPPLH
ncbi:hypothetical protein [Thiobaca trueperi]|uniref:Uncharacterized protein n=1 Tax=Thiobaca trueperi TaxID=127458 RepID=A0A4V2V1H3_9GAMM|nr:hypothetical protein [Thiobaca trueperi]TCT21212.1 hypothetical protein EDC35_10465 [Thiobaca trueperi]